MAHGTCLPYNEYIPLTKRAYGITADDQWQWSQSNNLDRR